MIRLITRRGSLRGLARWWFLVTLVVAPWLYGGTVAWTIEVIAGSLGVVLLVWVVSHVVDRSWPRVPRSLVLIAGLVLVQGWWMTLNAHAVFDSGYRVFVPMAGLVPGRPGATDYVLSFAMMLRVTALVGTICLVAEMMQRAVWLLRLWYALAIAGGSIAILGLAQKGTGAGMIFWQPRSSAIADVKTFFASYYYHANAGAFLNLVLPAVAGLTLWMLMRRSYLGRAFWGALLLLVTLAVVSNTSRVAQVIAGLLLAIMIVVIFRRRRGLDTQIEKKTVVIGLVVVAATILAVAQASRLDQPFERWQSFSVYWQKDARWLANRVAFSATRDVGLLGFGPGTFRVVFPHYQERFPELGGRWRFLHDDYLQTIMEWGWIGSATLAALFFGGLFVGIRSGLRARSWSNRQHIFLWCTVLALAGVAIHAVVDFPLQIFSIQILAAAYVGVCWGSGNWARNGERETERSRRAEERDRGRSGVD